MTIFIVGAAIGAVAKTLLPWPALDDKIRAGWRWAWTKVT